MKFFSFLFHHGFLATMLLLLLPFFAPAQTNTDAITGQWLSAAKDTKFMIYKSNGKYYGKVVWGSGTQTTDEKNPNPQLRSRPLTGIVILNNFVFNGKDTWTDGTIYDPREGKTYSCKITMKDNNTLEVRGYVGISLFGRTETWTRVKE
jgi:uncharacterized protein (DUF2147 family)